MHIFFVNKYQTKFNKSIDKTYIDIFLKKTWAINPHDTIPYLDPIADYCGVLYFPCSIPRPENIKIQWLVDILTHKGTHALL